MYALSAVEPGGLGEVLATSATLNKDELYTFTFLSGKTIQTQLDSTVRTRLQYYMQNYGTVTNVSRGYFSDRFAVTVLPKANNTVSQWLTAFTYSWQNMGFPDASFLMVEGGSSSSQPGGVRGATGDVGKGVAASMKEMLAPLLPYLIGGVVLLVVVPPLLQGAASGFGVGKALKAGRKKG